MQLSCFIEASESVNPENVYKGAHLILSNNDLSPHEITFKGYC